MRLKRNLKIALLLAILLTGGAAYVRSNQKPAELTVFSIQSGAQTREALIGNQLRDLLTPVGVQVPTFHLPEAATAKQVTVHWETSATDKTAMTTEQTSGRLAVAASRAVIGNLPQLRSVQLGETEIFVAAVDVKQQLVWWHVMSDPRQLRIQTVTETGEISCQVVYQPNANFLISYPDETSITELRLYHPRWTGTKFELLLIGTMSVS